MMEVMYRGEYCGESPNVQGIDGETMVLDSEWGRQATDPIPRLEVGILMYYLADQYSIGTSANKATDRFEALDRDFWPLDELPLILTAVLGNTPHNDDHLRVAALRIFADHIRGVLTDKTWTDFLAQKGEAAVAITTTFDNKHDRQTAWWSKKVMWSREALRVLRADGEERYRIGEHADVIRADITVEVVAIEEIMDGLELEIQADHDCL